MVVTTSATILPLPVAGVEMKNTTNTVFPVSSVGTRAQKYRMIDIEMYVWRMATYCTVREPWGCRLCVARAMKME